MNIAVTKSVATLISMVLFISCGESPETASIHKCGDCADQLKTSWGVRLPALYYKSGLVTIDGKSFIYRESSSQAIFVQDLRSGDKRFLTIHAPDSARVDLPLTIVLCPYDSSIILVQCIVSRDTSGGKWRFPIRRMETFVCNLDGKIIRSVTPYDITSSTRFVEYSVRGWLSGSSPERDYINMAERGIYVPQEKRYAYAYTPHMRYVQQSPDGSHWFGFGSGPGTIAIDGELARIPDGYSATYYGGWSPDGSKFVNHVERPFIDPCEMNIMIFDIEEYAKDRSSEVPHIAINTQREYCMFTSKGAYPVFITDSTFAISMHEDGASISHYWEVGLNGEILRCLTK